MVVSPRSGERAQKDFIRRRKRIIDTLSHGQALFHPAIINIFVKNMALDYLVKQFFLFDVFFSQVSLARNMLVGFLHPEKRSLRKK